ncbi:hypothetical protein V8B55DRAFT_1439696 [Mucor lusitanicus]
MSTIEIADRHLQNSSAECKKRAEQLMQSIGPVVNSRPAEMVFLNNIKQQSKDLLKTQLVQEELDGLTGRSVATATSTAAILEQTASSAPRKMKKYLKPIDLRASTPSKRVKALATR